MSKLIAALAVVSALGFASSAFAAPVQLSEIQLDQVTAGAAGSTATAGGFAFGNKSVDSTSVTVTAAGKLHVNGLFTANGAVGVAVAVDSATGTGSGPVIAASFATSSAHN